jgi:hypothetical protein
LTLALRTGGLLLLLVALLQHGQCEGLGLSLDVAVKRLGFVHQLLHTPRHGHRAVRGGSVGSLPSRRPDGWPGRRCAHNSHWSLCRYGPNRLDGPDGANRG